MTFREKYSQLQTKEELISYVLCDIYISCLCGYNANMVEIIVKAASKVAHERGWDFYVSNTKKLIPCPFCNGEAELIIDPFFQRKAVKCKKCYANIGMFDSAEQAIEAWNRRVHVKDEYEVHG